MRSQAITRQIVRQSFINQYHHDVQPDWNQNVPINQSGITSSNLSFKLYYKKPQAEHDLGRFITLDLETLLTGLGLNRNLLHHYISNITLILRNKRLFLELIYTQLLRWNAILYQLLQEKTYLSSLSDFYDKIRFLTHELGTWRIKFSNLMAKNRDTKLRTQFMVFSNLLKLFKYQIKKGIKKIKWLLSQVSLKSWKQKVEGTNQLAVQIDTPKFKQTLLQAPHITNNYESQLKKIAQFKWEQEQANNEIEELKQKLEEGEQISNPQVLASSIYHKYLLLKIQKLISLQQSKKIKIGQTLTFATFKFSQISDEEIGREFFLLL